MTTDSERASRISSQLEGGVDAGSTEDRVNKCVATLSDETLVLHPGLEAELILQTIEFITELLTEDEDLTEKILESLQKLVGNKTSMTETDRKEIEWRTLRIMELRTKFDELNSEYTEVYERIASISQDLDPKGDEAGSWMIPNNLDADARNCLIKGEIIGLREHKRRIIIDLLKTAHEILEHTQRNAVILKLNN